MQIKHRFKQLAALALSISMALLCMPVGAMPEDITTPTDLAPDEIWFVYRRNYGYPRLCRFG